MTETYRFSDRDQYICELDKATDSKYFRKRKISGSNQKEYVPIPIQEAIADYMFQSWNVIAEDYQVIVNEVVCTVRIAYTPSYPGAQECICTGSASRAIQCSAGSMASSFPNGKITNSLEYNLPAVRKAAIGCALEDIGNIFGRNVGRTLGVNPETKKTILLPADFSIRSLNEKTIESDVADDISDDDTDVKPVGGSGIVCDF